MDLPLTIIQLGAYDFGTYGHRMYYSLQPLDQITAITNFAMLDARKYCSRPYYHHSLKTWSDTQVMMAVNLLGYGFGSGGIMHLLQQIFGSWSLTFGMLATFFSAAHIMFELRRLEAAGSVMHPRAT